MKKSTLFLVTALSLSILACNKETEQATTSPLAPEDEQLVDITFIASTDNGELGTKTVLDGADDHIIKWASDETIYVFDGTAPRSFTNGDNTGSEVPFTGAALVSDKYYALFPSGFFVKSAGVPTINATVPLVQTATANSFDPKANISIAVANDVAGLNTMKFKNVAAVVKFTLKTSGIRKVTLESRGTENVAGDVNITLDGDNIPSASVTKGSTSVILDGGASDLAVDTPYYITILSGTYASGLKITFEKSDGKYRSFSNKNSQTLSRSGLMDFGEFTISSFKEPLVSDVINYKVTGVTGTSYTAFSGKSVSSSAVYAGQCAGKDNTVQLRATSPAGIITTTSGGKAKKVTVVWNSETTNNRTIDVYGKNVAYTESSELYSAEEATQGTFLGSIVNGTSTVLNIVGDYSYLGIRSNTGALYADSITVDWEGTGSSIPSVTPNVNITDITPAGGALTDAGGNGSFFINSNVHWTLSYSPDAKSDDVTYSSESVAGNTKINVTFPSMSGSIGDSRSVTFTVTPESGSPVNVTFTQTVVAKYTVTFSDGGSVTETAGGSGVVLPVRSDNGDWIFQGWSETEIASSTTEEPSIITDTYYPVANVTLYPVYKKTTSSEGATTWNVTTSLSVGKRYVFGAVKAAASKTLANNTAIGAINFTSTASWGSYSNITPSSDGKISSPASSCIWTLESISSNAIVLKNSSNKYFWIKDGKGESSAGVTDSSNTVYIENVTSTCKDAFMIHPTASSTNRLMLNTSSSYGYRVYASSTNASASMCPYIRFYEETILIIYTDYYISTPE